MEKLYPNIKLFEKLYIEYYPLLCMIAYEYTKDKMMAEDIVGEIFLNLWTKGDLLSSVFSLKGYLIKSTRNACLQHFRKKKLETSDWDSEAVSKYIPWSTDYPLDLLFEKELSEVIDKSIKKLPKKCRQVFLMSRDKEMSYTQIAEELNISENTVKTQIKTALLRIRFALRNYYQS